jgi:hypothetical protein
LLDLFREVSPSGKKNTKLLGLVLLLSFNLYSMKRKGLTCQICFYSMQIYFDEMKRQNFQGKPMFPNFPLLTRKLETEKEQ